MDKAALFNCPEKNISIRLLLKLIDRCCTNREKGGAVSTVYVKYSLCIHTAENETGKHTEQDTVKASFICSFIFMICTAAD